MVGFDNRGMLDTIRRLNNCMCSGFNYTNNAL